MKRIATVFAAMVVAGAMGCDNKTTPPAAADKPNGGVEVNAPGVHVDVDQDGVEVQAPGADVNVERAN